MRSRARRFASARSRTWPLEPSLAWLVTQHEVESGAEVRAQRELLVDGVHSGALGSGGFSEVKVLPAAGSLFDGTRAPSTVGSWLRAHKWSNVRQLDAVSRELLARLWACGAGPADPAAPLTIDLDSTLVEVHGRAKQGAAFGYTKVPVYHSSSPPARRPVRC